MGNSVGGGLLRMRRPAAPSAIRTEPQSSFDISLSLSSLAGGDWRGANMRPAPRTARRASVSFIGGGRNRRRRLVVTRPLYSLN